MEPICLSLAEQHRTRYHHIAVAIAHQSATRNTHVVVVRPKVTSINTSQSPPWLSPPSLQLQLEPATTTSITIDHPSIWPRVEADVFRPHRRTWPSRLTGPYRIAATIHYQLISTSDGSMLIASHWTVRATRPKCPTPPIESSIAAVLHLAPCPSANSLCDLARCGTHPSHLLADLLPRSGSGTTC
jgi:hypothetical protein